MIPSMDIRPDQQARIDDICRRYGVRRLDLFGSAAVGSERIDSDVDLLVDFIPGQAPSAFRLVDMQEELEQVFPGRRIDLAFPAMLRNPYRRRIVESQRRPLFA